MPWSDAAAGEGHGALARPPAAAQVGFRFYAITDRRRCAPRPLVQVVAALAAAGVRAVQVREKDLGAQALADLAGPLVAACRPYGCSVLINGSVEAAARVEAHGVHLPSAAPAVGQVRARSPRPLLVGASAHSVGEAQQRAAEGADFLTVSPVYPTESKPGYGPALGLAGLRAVCRAVPVPVFALAGVSPQRVAACLDQGAWGVAVMSGLMEPEAAGNCAAGYLQALARHTEGGP